MQLAPSVRLFACFHSKGAFRQDAALRGHAAQRAVARWQHRDFNEGVHTARGEAPRGAAHFVAILRATRRAYFRYIVCFLNLWFNI